MSKSSGKDDPNIGQVLKGSYTLISKLGEGGMGDVYKAQQAPLGREVAIKVLKSADSNPDGEHYFMREVQAINMLRHPNIIQIIDFGKERIAGEEETLFLVMEYLPGKTLKRVMRKEYPLAADRICHICIQILSALEQAHRSNVVHCDLKPANVMLEEVAGQRDFVKVLDFGIAKIKGPALEVGPYTQQGNIVGTFDYMSPEQILRKDLDGRADLWSLGVILHEILTKKRIFHDKDAVSIIGRVMQMPIESPRTILGAGKVHPELDRIIMKAMERNSSKRWQSASQMREAFEALLAALKGQGPAPTTPRGESGLDSWLGAGDSQPSQSSPSSMLGETPSGNANPPSMISRSGAFATPGHSGRLATGVAQGTSVLDQTFSIDALQDSLMGERRKVAVLSIQQRARRRGVDPEEMAKQARQEAQIIKDLVEHYDGQLDSFMGGTYTILFGASIARVGDNLRALECAMAIQERFGILEHGVANLGIALCYGEVFVSARRGGNAYGEAIDRCVEIARSAKEGRILVDGGLVTLTRQQVRYDVPTQLGGEPVHEVLGLQDSLDPSSVHDDAMLQGAQVHVQRTLYDEELLRRAQSVSAGQGGGVAILGAIGSGKTSLVEHFVQQRRKASWQAFEIKHVSNLPLAGVKQWIASIAKTYDDPQVLIRKACESLGLKKNLVAIVTFYADSAPNTNNPFPDQEAMVHFTAALFYRMMRFALKKGPLLLCYDDLDISDTLTIDFLGSLLAKIQSQKVLLLVTVSLDSDVRDHGLPGSFELLPLEGFTLQESKQYISQLLGFMPPADVLTQLHERASGNPMFLGELLHAIVRQGGSQALSNATSVFGANLPLHLHELLAQRIDELNNVQRDLLAIGSVLGESFRQAFFLQITPAHLGPQIVLEELVALGFIEEMDDARGQTMVGFQPRSLRAVVYDRLPKETRQKIHVSIIEFLEGGQEVAQLEPLEIPLMLAFHYRSLMAHEGAAHYLIRAGEMLLEMLDYDGAIHQLQESLALMKGNVDPSNPLFFAARIKLVKAYKESGRIEEARGILEEIEEQGNIPRDQQPEVLLEVGLLEIESGSLGKSTEALFSVLETAKQTSRPKLEVRAMLALAKVFEKENQLGRAANLLVEVSQKVASIGMLDLDLDEDKQLFWTAYNQLGTLFIKQQDIKQALHYLQEALGRAQQVSDHRGLLRVVSNLGALFLTVRDVPNALSYFSQALSIARETGDMLNQSRIMTNMGIATMENNQLEESKKHLRAARNIAEEIGWYEGLADLSLHIKRLRHMISG